MYRSMGIDEINLKFKCSGTNESVISIRMNNSNVRRVVILCNVIAKTSNVEIKYAPGLRSSGI